MSERGPYAKGRARREEILATALRVMSEQGYRNTSLRGIGRELGLQPAHILHYFSSREDLLESVIVAWDQRLPADRRQGDIIAGDVAPVPGITPDWLDRWLVIVRMNMQVPGLVHLYTAFAAEASDKNHPSHEFFERRFERVRQELTMALTARQLDGRVDPERDPSRIATNLVALSDGLQLQWLINPEVDMLRELREAIDRLRPEPAASLSEG